MSAPAPQSAVGSQTRVAARYMQTFIAHVDRLPELERRRVRARIPDGTLESIARAGFLGWLPGSVNLACTRAVAEELGTDGAHRFFRGLMMSTFETSLLRGVVEGALRIGFRDLTLYLPWITRGFDLLFRGFGRWLLVRRGASDSTMELRGLPAEFVSDPYWLPSVASGFTALFELVHTQGTVRVEEVDPSRGRAVLELRWSPL